MRWNVVSADPTSGFQQATIRCTWALERRWFRRRVFCVMQIRQGMLLYRQSKQMSTKRTKGGPPDRASKRCDAQTIPDLIGTRFSTLDLHLLLNGKLSLSPNLLEKTEPPLR